MDQEYEDYKPQLRGIAQQYEQKRRNFEALVQAAQLIPMAVNQRYAKRQWCAVALDYLRQGERRYEQR